MRKWTRHSRLCNWRQIDDALSRISSSNRFLLSSLTPSSVTDVISLLPLPPPAHPSVRSSTVPVANGVRHTTCLIECVRDATDQQFIGPSKLEGSVARPVHDVRFQHRINYVHETTTHGTNRHFRSFDRRRIDSLIDWVNVLRPTRHIVSLLLQSIWYSLPEAVRSSTSLSLSGSHWRRNCSRHPTLSNFMTNCTSTWLTVSFSLCSVTEKF